jgi:hypothetical protein
MLVVSRCLVVWCVSGPGPYAVSVCVGVGAGGQLKLVLTGVGQLDVTPMQRGGGLCRRALIWRCWEGGHGWVRYAHADREPAAMLAWYFGCRVSLYQLPQSTGGWLRGNYGISQSACQQSVRQQGYTCSPLPGSVVCLMFEEQAQA